MVERLREVKDHDELELIRTAAALADEALLEVLEGGLVGHSESEVAIELELRMRRLGAEGVSFHRSSQPASTARCRTPSPGRSRSRATCS